MSRPASAVFKLVSDPAYLGFEIGDSSISNAEFTPSSDGVRGIFER